MSDLVLLVLVLLVTVRHCTYILLSLSVRKAFEHLYTRVFYICIQLYNLLRRTLR